MSMYPMYDITVLLDALTVSQFISLLGAPLFFITLLLKNVSETILTINPESIKKNQFWSR